MNLASKLKWLAFFAVLLLLGIAVLQNLQQIELRFLIWTVSLPQSIVLVIAATVGFLLGVSARTMWKLQSYRSKQKLKKAD